MGLFALSEMESLVRAQLNAPTEGILSSAEIRRALNDGYKDVSRLAMSIENHDLVSTVSGDRLVPYDAHRVNFVYYGTAAFVGGGDGGGNEPGGGGNANEGGWVGGGDDSAGWLENLCFSASIGYTSLQMSVNEVQDLTINNSNEGVNYIWAITSGGGSLAHETGDHNHYTAPASNPSCANNPTISLSVTGYTCDTLSLYVSTGSNVAYRIFEYEFVETCPDYGTSSCKMTVYWRAYSCMGNRLPENDNVWSSTGYACTHESYLCDDPGLPPTCMISYLCNQSYDNDGVGYGHTAATALAGNPHDFRTAQMIEDGCCPEALL